MKLESWQLLAITIGAFAGIVILDLVMKYQTDETFRANFPKLQRAQFAQSIASTLQEEEQTAIPYLEEEASEEDQ